MRKIAVICSPGMDNHLADVADYFKSNYEVKICITGDLQQIFDVLKWADTVWIEWADQSALNVTRFEGLLFQKQVILRLHSYEAFTPHLEYIKWSMITDLIFVAEHIKEIVLEKYPKIANNVNRIHVIPNGIDINQFKLSRESKGKDLAYFGFINFKKAPLLMFTAFAELLKLDPKYKLHIGGSFQEERYKLYLDQLCRNNSLFEKQVRFYDWIEPEEWLKDKSHIICTSVLESQGKGVMEAMAMGLKPVIHNFVGADKVYPVKYLWNTVSEFCEMVLSDTYDSQEYRGYIIDNYGRKNQLEKIKSVLESHKKPIKVFITSKEIEPVKLSVIMIMKDEEKHIGRCLESVKDIADEIVIVDTGSTDKSVKIAESFGAKVYHHSWQDDFSLHRNQSIGYATGDWLLQIDADEELIGKKRDLKECLGKLNPEYNGVSVKLKDACQEEEGTQFNASRIFRKGKIQYRRAVHNMPIYEGADKLGAVLFNDATIVHYGAHYQISKEESQKKFNRTKLLLFKAMKEDPKDYELYFYLVQLYGTVEDYDKAIQYGEMYLAKRNEVVGFNNSIYYTIVRLYLEKKDYEKAYFWLKEARLILPDDLDIAFVTTELGVVTGNGLLLLQGARNYVRQYDIFQKRPDAKGSRFVFSQKPDCLYFVLKHMTSYLLGDGVDCLGKLKESIGFLPQKHQVVAAKEVEQMLKPIGVSTN